MNKKEIIYLLLFLFFILIFFRKMFFGMVPLPGNLQISFFSPWKEEKWERYLGGVPKQGLFGFDHVRQIYPWRHFSTEQIKKIQLPLWNPYQFSGSPHLANFQTAIFYPLNIIYLFLPQISAWTVVYVLQVFLAGIITYLFCRKIGLSPPAAAIGAFSFAFSLTMSVWLIYSTHGHQFYLLPLILYLIEEYREKKRKSIFFWITIVLSFTFLAGRPLSFLYILLFSGFYFFYRTKKIIPFILAGLASVLLTAFAWLPMLEYYQVASREIYSSEFSYLKTLWSFKNLITLAAPDFLGNPTTANYWGNSDYTESAVYAGVVALLFALVAFFDKKTRKKAIFFIAAFFAALAVCLDWFLPRLLFMLKVPFVTSTVATRSLFLATFCLSILSAFGVQAFIKKRKFPKEALLLGIFYFILFIFLVSAPKILDYQTWFESLRVMKRNLILPILVYLSCLAVMVAVLRFKKIKKYILIILFGLMALDLFYVANKVVPYAYPEHVFPSHPIIEFLQKEKEPFRFVGSNTPDFESNLSVYYRLYSVEGYDTMYPRYYGEFIWSAESGIYVPDVSRTTAVFPTTGSDGQKRLEDYLGIKHILEKNDDLDPGKGANYDIFPESRYELVWQRKNWKVYENKMVFPRAFLVDNYLVLREKEEVISRFFNSDFDPKTTVILEEEIASFVPSSQKGTAKILDYLPNKIVIKTDSESDKILVLSDTFYPGWEVFIDGKKDRVYKANHAFRAVVVPEGEHEVVFVYKPKSFQIGLFISIISLVFFISYIFYIKLKKL